MVKGQVIDGTPIAVNYWESVTNRYVELFFLTHFSSDNTEGLTESWNKKIYMSNITAQLLKLHFPFLASHIQALNFGRTHVLPLELDDHCVSVTLFNANHCPGSVVILFEGTFGTVLYTGDFRYYPDIMPQIAINCQSIDCLYFDNTYCSPHCNFPENKVVLEDFMNHIKQYIGKMRIIICSDLLGKEELLIELFNETKVPITVSPLRMTSLDALNLGYLAFTGPNKKNNALILLEKGEICRQKIKEWTEEMPTQIVLLTAKYVGATVRPFRKHKNVHIFPYSCHSSFTELVSFVEKIRPKKLFPIITEPLKNMFDQNQGSMESLNCLISSIKEQISTEEDLSIECCLPQSINDTDEFIKILLNLSPWNSDSDELPNEENDVSLEGTSNQNGKLSSDERSRKYTELFSKENLKLNIGEKFKNHLNGDPKFQNKVSTRASSAVPDFPDDLNEYFMSQGVSSSKTKGDRCTSRKRKKSDCAKTSRSKFTDCDDEVEFQNARIRQSSSSPKSTKSLHTDKSQNEAKYFLSGDGSNNSDKKVANQLEKKKMPSTQNDLKLDEIPSCFLSLIRKCQRKELRTLKKISDFNCDDEEIFLNQDIDICYGTKHSQYTKLRISNKDLLT